MYPEVPFGPARAGSEVATDQPLLGATDGQTIDGRERLLVD